MRALAAASCFLLLLFAASDARASCVCRCVAGSARAVCTSPSDLQPVCSALTCRYTPTPSGATQGANSGKLKCQRQQVWNFYKHKHEWRDVCH